MKFATRHNGHPDGQLFMVSRDLRRMLIAPGGFTCLREVLERWTQAEPLLVPLYASLNDGTASYIAPFDADGLGAPLPRAWQWLDASAFPSHGELMQRAFNLPPIESDSPLMYQGMSHRFLGPYDTVPMADEADGIDFEAEFGVITDNVPAGTSASDAPQYIRLCVCINDWSLRTIAPVEMKTGFGWIQAKPACSLAPIAVTPDELGDNWSNGRVQATMTSHLNGKVFGAVPADHMAYGFHELIAHAARTRDLCAGSIIGSGTVSSPHADVTGSSCIAEQRARETIASGRPLTPFMRFGDRVRIEALDSEGVSLFGAIDQAISHRGTT